TLSPRDVEDLLAERGVAVSSETALSRWRGVVGSSSTGNAAFLSSLTMLRAGFARHASEHPAFLGADRLTQHVATSDTDRFVGHGVAPLRLSVYGGHAGRPQGKAFRPRQCGRNLLAK